MPPPTDAELRQMGVTREQYNQLLGGNVDWRNVPTAGGGALRPTGMIDPNILRSVGLPTGMDANVIRSLGLPYGGAQAAASGGRNILSAIGSRLPSRGTAVKGALGTAGLGALAGLFGGGGDDQDWSNYYNTGPDIEPPMHADPWEGTADMAAAAQGGAGQDPLFDLLSMLMGGGAGGAGGGRYDTAADTMNAETNRMQAETQRYMAEAQVAQMQAEQANQEAEIALARGDRVLARQKFEDSQTWSQRAADANDYANQISATNAQTGRFNAQTGRLDTLGSQQIGGFNAMSADALGRAGMQARGAENLTGLTSTLGNIGAKQAELQAQLMSTPRNAISSLLMSRGQTPVNGGGYAPGNLLGFDPSMLTNAIQQAMGAAQQAAQPMAQAPFDLRAALAGLSTAANSAQGMMPQSMIPAAPTDPSGMRVVGNRVGGSNTGYQSVLDRMISGGAPQMVIDQFRRGADEAGYSVNG